jgi:hypothetical protein
MEASPRSSSSRWPPPSVWREVDDAARVWERLRAQGRELHFQTEGATGRLTIQLRDLDGNVLRALAPGEALAIISGSPA